MEWGAIITAIGTIAVLLVKTWLSNKPQRDERKKYDDIQQGRKDIIDGNVDAVRMRIDRLLSTSNSHQRGEYGKTPNG